MNEIPLRRPGRSAPQAASTPGFALWQLGFRPFYLLASVFSAASVALWVLQYSGVLAHPYVDGPLWHGHEMLFGYAVAIIAGFLLTAVRNWTGHPTVSGGPLIALAALWVAARLLILTPWNGAAALVNVAFPWAVAVTIGVPLVRARNRRNYFFIALFVLLGLLSLVVQMGLRGAPDAGASAGAAPGFGVFGFGVSAPVGLRLGLDVVLFVMAVMAGRVVPMFTNNGVPGANAVRHPWIEKLSLGAVLALFVADLAGSALVAVVAGVGALAHGARLSLWRPWRTLRAPLVWVLHAAYAWIVVHLTLRALAAEGFVADTLATHALTAGGIGVLTLGMMTRTARGHTARPLRADNSEVAVFLLVLAAAVVRVAGPLLLPQAALGCIQLSALLWAGAFGLYAVRYWPVLSRSRLDGKPG